MSRTNTSPPPGGRESRRRCATIPPVSSSTSHPGATAAVVGPTNRCSGPLRATMRPTMLKRPSRPSGSLGPSRPPGPSGPLRPSRPSLSAMASAASKPGGCGTGRSTASTVVSRSNRISHGRAVAWNSARAGRIFAIATRTTVPTLATASHRSASSLKATTAMSSRPSWTTVLRTLDRRPSRTNRRSGPIARTVSTADHVRWLAWQSSSATASSMPT